MLQQVLALDDISWVTKFAKKLYILKLIITQNNLFCKVEEVMF